MVEAVHVGEPSLDDPKRTLAPDITKENVAMFTSTTGTRQAAAADSSNADRPERAAAQRSALAGAAADGSTGGWNGVGVEIVNAPSGDTTASRRNCYTGS